MLKKLQHRFIRITSIALLMVFLFLLTAINLLNFWNFLRNSDAMLRLIARMDGRLPDFVEITPADRSREPWLQFTEETPFFTRFFVVRGTDSQAVTETQMGKIAAVSDGDARTYYARAIRSGREYGFCGDYRYLVETAGTDHTVIFLDCSRELASIRTFLWSSLTVTAFACCVLFITLTLLSSRAIRPMLQNIRQQKQFITDAGHELKTPLTVISTSADVLAQELPENEWLENIRTQARKMSGLLGHLISLSRMEEADFTLKKDTFSLSEAVWDVAGQFCPLAEARGKRLLLTVPDDLSFRGDASAIQQMLSLLLDNAVKYALPGTDIHLRLRRDRGIILELENQCDLPRELDPERLFDRFFRPDSARTASSGGNGIGLSVARALAQVHGGTLTASLRENTICFTAFLPLT